MNLTTLLKDAERGVHPACTECPWNPNKQKELTAFGVSCKKHGVDWTVPVTARSVLIAQDPGGTTPEKTGNLCGVCNAQFSTDESAKNGLELWKAAVSLKESAPEALKYFKNHYWTNAIMHGVKGSTELEKARNHCEKILEGQLTLLSPDVIIVTGKIASWSLFNIGLITKCWDEFSRDFSVRPYIEVVTLPSGKKTTVFCTFHGSARAVNTHAAKAFTSETKDLIIRKIEALSSPLPAQRYIRLYPGVMPKEKGMLVLLLHWLHIGEAIRTANGD